MPDLNKTGKAKASETYDLNGNGILESGYEATLAMDEIAKKVGEDHNVLKIIHGMKTMTTWLRDRAGNDFNALSHTYPDKGEAGKKLKVSPAVLEEIVDKTLSNQNMIKPSDTPNNGIDKSKSIKVSL
jgi:hypothetical protein